MSGNVDDSYAVRGSYVKEHYCPPCSKKIISGLLASL